MSKTISGLPLAETLTGDELLPVVQDGNTVQSTIQQVADFVGNSTTWGDIQGTLSNQTDLQTALDAKVPYTGATGNVNLGEYGLTSGYFQADLTPTNALQVGRMVWNPDFRTTDLGLGGGNVVLHIGQKQVILVVNKTGATLTGSDYQVVKISGAQGQRPKVDLAQANNDANSADTIGLVNETITNNQEGFVCTTGTITNINTTGSMQGETWADGDVLYLSGTTAGRLTNIKPQAPIHTVIVGFVIYAHNNQGKIYVKVDNGYELDELHNVRINGVTNGQVLTYNNGLWENQTNGSGTVTSVSGTGGYGGLTLTGTVTSSGNLTLGGTPTGTWPVSVSGNAATVTNGVYTTGDQTIGGTKTFSSAIAGSITGNAGTVDNGVYTTGNQTIVGTKTFSSDVILSGIAANSVLYLTASRYITGGGTLVFNGSQLGINVSSPSYSLDVAGTFNIASNGSSNTATINHTSGSGIALNISKGGDNEAIYVNKTSGSGNAVTVVGTVQATSFVGALTGNASTVTNGVYTTGDQTIGGTKTFSSTISGSVSGNAGTVTNGVYTTGDQTIAGIKTFSGASTIVGGNFNLSGGTANGVTYLNGSKNLTTGSALTFNGSGLGIGTSAVAGVSLLDVETGSGRIQLRSGANTGGTGSGTGIASINSAGNAIIDLNYRATNHAWVVNSSEAMRLTSTGLGIGTTSPSAPLDVVSDGSAVGLRVRGRASDNFGLIQFGSNNAVSDYAYIGSPSANQIAIYTNGFTERMRITSAGDVGIGTTSPTVKLDVNGAIATSSSGASSLLFKTSGTTNYSLANQYPSAGNFSLYDHGASATVLTVNAGNLGLGVTPSAWSSSQRALQIKDSNGLTGSVYAGFSAVGIGSNGFYNGTNNLYIANGFASSYEQISGTHKWFNAPSGTAGNAITFTQAMTLDASGRLSVGTTGTAGILNLKEGAVSFEINTSGTDASMLAYDRGTSAYKQLSFRGSEFLFKVNDVEKMRLDSAGNIIQTVNTTAATLGTNNTLTFSIVDNSTLRISVRGSDGTTRTATVALT
jgi:hypothetical protein